MSTLKFRHINKIEDSLYVNIEMYNKNNNDFDIAFYTRASKCFHQYFGEQVINYISNLIEDIITTNECDNIIQISFYKRYRENVCNTKHFNMCLTLHYNNNFQEAHKLIEIYNTVQLIRNRKRKFDILNRNKNKR